MGEPTMSAARSSLAQPGETRVDTVGGKQVLSASRNDPSRNGKLSSRECRSLMFQVFTVLHGKLVSFARTRVDEPDRAEDLVQELSLRLPELLRRARTARASPGGDIDGLLPYLRGCLWKIAANDTAREKRHEARLRQLNPANACAGLEEELEARWICDAVLKQLHPSDAEVLRLSYLEDRSAEDVAPALGISVAVMWKRASRARERAKAASREMRER